MDEKNIRITRKEVLDLCKKHELHHVSSAFSIIEILNVIYSLKKPEDKVILSKGHGCAALYTILQKLGFSPKIAGHPDIDETNGITCTTGSLGHGLPIGVGIALAKKLKKESGKVYIIIGDGECQEGSVWESILIASKYKLNNLIIIVDNNKQQCLGYTKDIMPLGDIYSKFTSFGCEVRDIDGHNECSLYYSMIKGSDFPKVIIARTLKGKGLKFEGKSGYHVYLPEYEDLNE